MTIVHVCDLRQGIRLIASFVTVICTALIVSGISCDISRITRELLLLCEPVSDVMVYRGRVVSEDDGDGISGLQLGLIVFVDGKVFSDLPRWQLHAVTDAEGAFAFALTESASACDKPPEYPVPDRLTFRIGCTDFDTPIEQTFSVSGNDVTETEFGGAVFSTIDVGTMSFPGCEN